MNNHRSRSQSPTPMPQTHTQGGLPLLLPIKPSGKAPVERSPRVHMVFITYYELKKNYELKKKTVRNGNHLPPIPPIKRSTNDDYYKLEQTGSTEVKTCRDELLY